MYMPKEYAAAARVLLFCFAVPKDRNTDWRSPPYLNGAGNKALRHRDRPYGKKVKMEQTFYDVNLLPYQVGVKSRLILRLVTKSMDKSCL